MLEVSHFFLLTQVVHFGILFLSVSAMLLIAPDRDTESDTPQTSGYLTHDEAQALRA